MKVVKIQPSEPTKRELSSEKTGIVKQREREQVPEYRPQMQLVNPLRRLIDLS
jgi:hypothetical protein